MDNLNLNGTDAYLQDASESAVVKMMIQLYCIPGTRRSEDGVLLKDFTYVIGDIELGAPAGSSGIISAVDMKSAMTQAITRLADMQDQISHMIEEHNNKIRASQQIVTPNFGRR